jgi:hypothetical protein
MMDLIDNKKELNKLIYQDKVNGIRIESLVRTIYPLAYTIRSSAKLKIVDCSATDIYFD